MAAGWLTASLALALFTLPVQAQTGAGTGARIETEAQTKALKPADATADDQAIAALALTAHSAPRHRAFAAAGRALQQALAVPCQTWHTTNAEHITEAFTQIVRAHAGLEHWRPQAPRPGVTGRSGRLIVWPAPGLAQKVERLLEARAARRLNLADIRMLGRSLRSLSALEVVLFAARAGGATPRLRPSSPASCAYARGVADHVAQVAAARLRQWQPGQPGAVGALAWRNSTTNASGRHARTTHRLIQLFDAGLRQVRDDRLARSLGLTRPRRPRLEPPFQRSGLALVVMRANIVALHSLYVETKLATLTPQAARTVKRHLSRALLIVDEIIASRIDPFASGQPSNPLIDLGVPLKMARHIGTATLAAATDLERFAQAGGQR
ncbi:MAG: imelysin family protein [Pseudomonadota bacterium]